MAEQTDTRLTPSTTGPRLRLVWLGLLVFNVVMLMVTVPPLVRGEADAYHNQHARLVTGAATGLLLAGSFLVRPPAKWMLLVASFLAVGVSGLLAFR